MKWISVEDQLPETKTPVLVMNAGHPWVALWSPGATFTGNWDEMWVSDDCENELPDVTHWAEITPPEGSA